MSDVQAIADRLEIEALRGEFTDAGMMRDYHRFASLFTPDGAWRMPHINVEFVSREEIRAGIERLQGLWDYFMQNVHPGTIQLEGDTAVGRNGRVRYWNCLNAWLGLSSTPHFVMEPGVVA
jgi:hypothetical protein